MSGHLLERLEAGVGLEGLPDRDAGLFAELVVPQAAGKQKNKIEMTPCIKSNLSRTPPSSPPQQRRGEKIADWSAATMLAGPGC